MPPRNGSCNSYWAASEALPKAQESIPNRKILDSWRIRDEKHCKMGDRQVKIRVWCEVKFQRKFPICLFKPGHLYRVRQHLQPVSFWFAQTAQEENGKALILCLLSIHFSKIIMVIIMITFVMDDLDDGMLIIDWGWKRIINHWTSFIPSTFPNIRIGPAGDFMSSEHSSHFCSCWGLSCSHSTWPISSSYSSSAMGLPGLDTMSSKKISQQLSSTPGWASWEI